MGTDLKQSLKYLNVKSLRVGKVHQSLSMLPNDVRAVKTGNTKMRLLTDTYTLQENRAMFNQHAVDDTCALYMTNAESRQHFLVECSRLENVRHRFRSQIREILLHFNNSENRVQSYISDKESLTQLLMDSSVCGAKRRLILTTEETIDSLEKLSRSWCFALHRHRSEILGLRLGHVRYLEQSTIV